MKEKFDLVLDLGNSTLALLLYKDKEVGQMHYIKTVDITSKNAFINELKKIDSIFYSWELINNIYLSSVNESKTKAIIDGCVSYFHKEVNLVSINVASPLINMDTVPSEIGSDIYANLVAARYKNKDKVSIVVDFGTALTLSAIDENGNILGATITLGPFSIFNSLLLKASGLQGYDKKLSIPKTVLGSSTQSALDAGVFYMVSGAVKEGISKIEQHIGASCYKIATGGGSEFFAPFIGVFDEIDRCNTCYGIYKLFNNEQ